MTTPFRPPRQRRSQASAAAIVAATRALLADRPFHQIAVTDLARHAGISVGGFYGRFRDKASLLEVLDADVLDSILATFHATMDRVDRRGVRAETVIRAYVRVMVSEFRRHRTVIQTIRRHASTGTGSGYAERIRAFNTAVHGRLRTLLLARRTEITHPDPAFALEFGLFLASAAAREAILAEALRAYPIAPNDRRVISEITRAWCAYLGLPSHGKRTRRCSPS